jgi:beta-glucosidase
MVKILSFPKGFLWAEGFKFRFGLIEIDYQNLIRIIRKSALFYAKISKENKLEI